MLCGTFSDFDKNCVLLQIRLENTQKNKDQNVTSIIWVHVIREGVQKEYQVDKLREAVMREKCSFF